MYEDEEWEDLRWHVNERIIEEAGASEMMSPVRCRYCPGVYDLGSVTVTARYADCSMWKSPCCDMLVDDRSWKPDYEHLRRR